MEFISGNVTFNAANGSPGTGGDDNVMGAYTFTFPHDLWFPMEAVVNMDNSMYTFTVNDVQLNTTAFNDPAAVFGGLDLYAADAANGYYIDDVSLIPVVSSIEDIDSSSFIVYPNPVQDVLNINSPLSENNIQIFDILGQRVLETFSNTQISTLDLSALNSGTYFVNISAGDYSKTVKLIK